LQKIETRKPSAKAKRPADLPVTIAFNTEGMPDDCHLYLVKISDEQRRTIQINASEELSRAGNSLKPGFFDLTVPAGAVRLSCTFGVWKSRFVEFIAKPRTK
jgi:hypothetical protein